MSSHKTARLLRSATYLPVPNVEKTIAYYRQKLNFQCEYSAGQKPLQFAICSRDGLAVMFRLIPQPELIVPNEEQGGTWDAFFWVSDAAALYSEFAENGADIVYGPLIQDAYNMKEFAVRDCDGHVLGLVNPWAA